MDNWQDLLGDFLEEAYSLLESLEDSLLQLEKNVTDKECIDTVFRVAHTIKGGAGAIGFENVTKLTHIMEDLLDLVRQHKYILTNNDITLLLEVKDELEVLLKDHEHGVSSSDKYINLIKALENIKSKALLGNIQDSVINTPIAVPSQEILETQSYSSLDIDKLPIAARFGLNNELMNSINQALLSQESLLFIEIRFNEDYELKEVGPFEILNLVNSFAEPIVMNPSPESLDEEYIPFLNIVISSEQSTEYIQSKLFLSDVVTKIVVHKLTEEFFVLLEKSMKGEFSDNIDNISNTSKDIDSEALSTTNDVMNNIENTNIQPEIQAQQSKKEEDVPLHVEKRSPTLKVESIRIDELLNLLGELVIIRSGLNQFGTELEQIIYNSRLNLRSVLNSNNLLPLHSNPEINQKKNEQFKSDFALINSNIEHFIDYIQQLSRISSTLQTKMMNLRMVPVQTVFSRFIRLTRDITKQLDKKVELIIEGGETEIDKGIIDDLYDPLMHMIRNSLDHGIEAPDVRIQAHKNPIGIIKLKAYQEGDSIFIEISDDGKGIDAENIATKVIEKGFMSKDQIINMSHSEKLSLIFLPGFSTADQISNLSGRGVGMDVVHKKIQDLGGSVAIQSTVGQGSVIRIQLPLTLAIIQGLLIFIENVYYVIPISSVEETIIINSSQLYKLDNYYAIKFREKLIPLISLPHVLYNHLYKDNDIENQPNKNHQYCIIVRFGSRQVGIIVPEILKEQDIVIKSLDSRLVSSPGISAATIVGNGEVGFILDLPQIIHHYFKH